MRFIEENGRTIGFKFGTEKCEEKLYMFNDNTTKEIINDIKRMNITVINIDRHSFESGKYDKWLAISYKEDAIQPKLYEYAKDGTIDVFLIVDNKYYKVNMNN